MSLRPSFLCFTWLKRVWRESDLVYLSIWLSLPLALCCHWDVNCVCCWRVRIVRGNWAITCVTLLLLGPGPKSAFLKDGRCHSMPGHQPVFQRQLLWSVPCGGSFGRQIDFPTNSEAKVIFQHAVDLVSVFTCILTFLGTAWCIACTSAEGKIACTWCTHVPSWGWCYKVHVHVYRHVCNRALFLLYQMLRMPLTLRSLTP